MALLACFVVFIHLSPVAEFSNEKCRIYPIIIDDSDPPLLLSQIKYLRTLDNPDYVYQLIKGLHQQFAKPEKNSQESSL